MANPLNRMRYRNARRKYLPSPMRGGRTGWIAALLVVAIGAVTLLLEIREGGRASAIVERLSAGGEDPLELVAAAGRSHRLVFLADVPGSATTKWLAAEAAETLARTSGLDAVVVAVDPVEQPWIDRYIDSADEDAAALVARPRALGANEGTGTDLLPLFRRIWLLNRELGATRRIRIVAADAPGWPPERALSPANAVSRFGDRDRQILDALESRVLARDPRARVLVFMDGLHVVRARYSIETGGAAPVDVVPAAAAAAERFPGEVFSFLVDASVARGTNPPVASYRGTSVRDALRRAGIGGAWFGLHVDPAFGRVADIVSLTTMPGVTLTFRRPDAPLASAADAYIFLGSSVVETDTNR